MNTPLQKKERRAAIRKNAHTLPPALHTIRVSLPDGTAVVARTLDASRKGLGFVLPLPAHLITDPLLTIQSADLSFTVREEIVYLKSIDRNSCRASVLFTHPAELNRYFELLSGQI